MAQKTFAIFLLLPKMDSIDKNTKNLPKNRRIASLRGGTTKQSRQKATKEQT